MHESQHTSMLTVVQLFESCDYFTAAWYYSDSDDTV